jgi:hypothetical protein
LSTTASHFVSEYARMAEKKLLNYGAMSRQLGVAERTLRDWTFKRKVPSLRIGHRTVLFDPVRVRAALIKFEVAAAASKSSKAPRTT